MENMEKLEQAAIVIIVVFGISMAVVVVSTWRTWWRRQQVITVASIVTIIGVLGTFFGIAFGLYYFDPDRIEESVPLLLQGLKLAFVTSIAGIFISIVLKIVNLWKKQATPSDIHHGATIDDLAGLLQRIFEAEQEEGKETRETLQSIEKALTGEGDSTVLTQLQRLRLAFSDKQDELIRSFNDFAAQMAENNTNALIEALESVMRDFNTRINEQFGENFRQLNEAVGRINDWQEQYRQQMDELAAQFRVAADSIETSRTSLEIIADRSAVIVSSAEELGPILQALQHLIGQLNNHLAAFSTLADNARDAFPIIEDRLNQLTEGFTTSVEHAVNDSHASMQSQREALAEQSQQLAGVVESTGNYIQQQTEALFQNTTARVEQIIQDSFQGLRTAIEGQSTRLATTVDTASGKLETIATRFTEVVRETIENSHASMDYQREALTDQSQLLARVVEDTGKFIQQRTETVFQEATVRVEQIIDNTFQGLRTALENQSNSLVAMVENSRVQVEEMTAEFSRVVRESIDNSHDDMQRQRQALQDFTGRVEGVIQTISQRLENTLEETNRRFESTLQSQSEHFRTEMGRIFNENGQRITQQIQALDKALEEELTKALESLGGQLTSLSKRFVDDYSPLTNQLRDVVKMADSLRQTPQYQNTSRDI